MQLKEKNKPLLNEIDADSWSNEEATANICAIVDSLDFLRNEAKKIGKNDVADLIEATFTMCLHAYYISLKDDSVIKILKDRHN